jgi:AraC family transcriptional regulator
MPRSFVPVTLGSPRSRCLRAPGFNVVHAWFPAGTWLPPHVHEETNFAVMLEGSFDLSRYGKTLACPPGAAVIEPAGERHANRMGTHGAEVIVIQPEPDSADLFRAVTHLFERPVHTMHGGIRGGAAAIVRELDAPDGLSTLAIEGQILLMFSALGRCPPRRSPETSIPPWLARMVDRLHAECVAPVRISELAREAQVEPITLARVFRRFYRVPLGSYARQLRLERCAALLRNTGTSLAEVALAGGFADQSHFTRAFRTRYGVTPQAFRRGNASDERRHADRECHASPG